METQWYCPPDVGALSMFRILRLDYFHESWLPLLTLTSPLLMS